MKGKQFKELMLNSGWLRNATEEGTQWRCKDSIILEKKAFSGKTILQLPNNAYGYLEDLSSLSFHPDRLLITWNTSQEWYLPYCAARINATCYHY